MDSGDDSDTVFPRYVLYSSSMHHEPASTSPKRFSIARSSCYCHHRHFRRMKRLHACGETQVRMLQGESYELVEDTEWVDPLLALVGP